MTRPERRVYLNNAATSYPKAPGLGRILAAAVEEIPRHPGRGGGNAPDTVAECRRELERLIKAPEASRLVLCKNATEAMNVVLHGLGLREGDRVLTSAVEHNSTLRPLYLLEKKGAARLVIVRADRQGRIDIGDYFDKLENHRPKVVVLNHASNVTGAVNDLPFLLEPARNNGSLTVVDASQTIGLLPLDVLSLGADILVFTGHKYLLGPTGTGGFYVRSGLELEPVFVGGTGLRSDLREMPPEMPLRLEPGTPNILLAAGLLHSLRWSIENPVPWEKMMSLTAALEEGLTERGAQVIRVQGPRTPIVSFLWRGWDPEDLGFLLDGSFHIYCRTGLHCAPLIHAFLGTAPAGTIRFSLSRFTEIEDVERSLEAMSRIGHESH